ncbi:hypothetical protein EV401DRAFT_1900491, partial [Pisolithus croceorrhizus]
VYWQDAFRAIGTVVSMVHVWYTGPTGKKARATYGANLGFGVSTEYFLHTGCHYGADVPPLRRIEIKLTRR